MSFNLTKSIKKHSSALLCVFAAGGVAVTAVLAAKETPKAIRLFEQAKEEELSKTETFIVVAPAYIPATISGILTIACIFSANVLSKSNQAVITSAYALLNEQYKRYKNKVVEHYGKESHERIMQELAVEKTADTHIYTPGVFGSCSSLEFEDSDEETHIFYDSFSDRYFESTFSRVLAAELALNRNMALGMSPALNDFYDLLGLDKTEDGEEIGWSFYNMDYMWVDFNHIKMILDDDTPCWIIECTSLCEPTEWDDE